MIRSISIATILLTALTLAAAELSEDDLKYRAEFIVNVLEYVTWPDGAATDSNGAVVIAVVGESPLLSALTSGVAEKAKEGKNIVIKPLLPDDDLTACQILFIASDDKTVLAKILKKVDGKPVLTISDAEYFANFGVMVNFIRGESEDKKKFEINKMVLDMSRLKMSSQLLKLARII